MRRGLGTDTSQLLPPQLILNPLAPWPYTEEGESQGAEWSHEEHDGKGW